jgi:hypothetical protein
LEPGADAGGPEHVVQCPAHVPHGRGARGDDLGREGAPHDLLGHGDAGAVVLQLLGQARVEVFGGESLGAREACGGVRAHRLGEEQVGVMSECARLSAAPADAERDRARLVSLPEPTQGRPGRQRFGRRGLEEPREVLLGVAGDRELLEALRAGVDEDEDVPVAGVRARRGDLRHDRVVVELLVDHDPHRDLVRPHHRKEPFVLGAQPLLPHGDLLAPGEELRGGGDDRPSAWRDRLRRERRRPEMECGREGEGGDGERRGSAHERVG